MSVNLVQFPLTVSEWQKAVTYQTDVIIGRNGQEVRNALWQDPLLKFNAAFAVRSYADIGTLTTFFHAMRGREKSFLVKDWADFQITDWTTSTTATGGGVTQFQLVKRYNQAGVSEYVRTIKYPRSNSPTTTVTAQKGDGTPLTVSSVNTSTGMITLSAAVTSGTVQFKCTEFYVPCRFDIDELPVEMLNYWVSSGVDKSNVQVPEIPLIEVRIS